MAPPPSLLPVLTAQLAPGIWQLPQLPADSASQATAVGWATIAIDIDSTITKSDLLDQLGAAGKFPDYFGRNWDAAADCLQDLSWLNAPGYLLTVANAHNFNAGHFRLQTVLLDVLSETIDHWNGLGTPFQVLWESEQPREDSHEATDLDARIANLPDDSVKLGTVTEWPTPSTSNEY